MDGTVRGLLTLQGDGDRLGNRPHEAYQLTRNGRDNRVGMLPKRDPWAVSLPEPDLGLPANILERLGLFCQSAVERPAHLRWVPIRPGAFNEAATGLGSPGFRTSPLAAA